MCEYEENKTKLYKLMYYTWSKRGTIKVIYGNFQEKNR